MKITPHHKLIVFLALILWVFSASTGAHNHICLDGQEPPISVHLGHLMHGPDHHDEDIHQDLDIDIPQNLTSKFSKVDIPILLLALVLVLLPTIIPRAIPVSYHGHYRSPNRLRPPLRAPPLSA